MADEGFKRKLTAILSADAVGYSRLMAEDEAATVKTMASYREIMSSLIKQYRGRVVDSPGDNVLAEFSSVVDAVRCAVAVQNEFQARNAELPENRRMEFRIGINLGDVIIEEDRLYGDGVNIAARLEALADAGGVCISGTAFDQVKGKLSLGFQFVGEQTVKNIPDPIRIYKVLMDERDAGKLIGVGKKAPKSRWAEMAAIVVFVAIGLVIYQFYVRSPAIEPASVEKMAFPLPDKPSIAVLPFNNLSGDPSQDYISDGISENIISDLSKISEMFVIASNSTFTYKGKPVKVQQVSEELGVRYVLEGSAQKIGNRLRITAQLIDATTGRHLWSEKYDRNMEDLFALQDEITHKIIVELQVKLTEGEQARVSHKSTTNLEAWSYAVRGLKLFKRISKENNAKAMELFERAVELDPGYVWAWVRLAWTHVMAMTPGWGPSPSESFKKTVEISQKVLALDDSDSDVRALLGLVYLIQGRYEEALAEGEKSLALGPTNAQAHVLQAVRMHHVGRFDDGIELVKKAMRLHPYYPAYYLQWLGAAYRMTGRYEDALQIYKQLLDRANKGEFPSLEAHVFLADVCTELDRVEEAQTHAAEVLKLKPGLSLAEISSNISTYTFKDPAHLERRLNALRKSGIPEHPPLRLPDKPSIAVLAFDNLSGDPKQEYFSDGISEEIITALSKTPKLFVIARTSSFKFKGKEVDVRTVGRELGVRYVLEGSIRKAGDKVRITAQLIDAKTNNHIWADRYDRELKDIFAIQDEITLEILKAMQVKLTDGEYARTFARGTNNIDAYLKAYQASALLWHREDTEDIRKARRLAMEAMALDPKYAIPYTTLAWSHMMDVFMQSTESTQESMKLAAAASKKALEIDGSHPQVHKVLSNLYIMQGESDKAIASAKRAVELSPGDSLSFANLGLCLMFACKPIEAIPMYEKALRRNPFSDFTHHRNLAWVYLMVGRYDDAIEELQKAVQKNPSNYHIYYNLVLAYTKLGRNEKARAAAAELLEIYPKFSLDWWAKTAVKMYAKECQSAIHNDIEFLRKSDVGLK